MNIPADVLAKAYRMVADALKASKWLGDDEDWWVEIDADWDLCFWSDFSDTIPLRCATIFEVVDGQTQTITFKRIFESDYVNMEVKA